MRDASYWATILQIVPVFMLALVVEGRFFASKRARKQQFQRTFMTRTAYAILFTFSCIAMLIVFVIALEGAQGQPLTQLQTQIAETSLLTGVTGAFTLPGLDLSGALLVEAVVRLHRKMPYSKFSRDARFRKRRRDEADALERELRTVQLSARINISRAWVRNYQCLREDPSNPATVARFEANRAELNYLTRIANERSARIEQEIARLQRKLAEPRQVLEHHELDRLRMILKDASG
ncbi:hypothetical protein [Microbacterium sp. YY-01]|uniref:hypothetical protein n=1 Tax=Microbacterium sp. YY-01 TaxID=3421634 RepID=UPI003D185CB5